jgi:N-acetylneuraminic acid mutarotase
MRYFKPEYLMLALAAVMLGGCSKDSDDTELEGNWMSLKAFFGSTRTEATGFVIGDSAYVGTGYQPDQNIFLKDFFVYDPKRDQWSIRAALPEAAAARSSAVGFAADGMGFLGTGNAGNNKWLNDFWRFDPKKNAWEPVKPFPGTARWGAVSFSLKKGNKDFGFVATGYDNSYMQDCWRYDPAADSWTEVNSVPNSKRRDASAFVINNKAYIVAGYNSLGNVNEVSIYDPESDNWTLSPRRTTNVSDDSYDDDYSSIVRSNGAAFVINNKAYLCTGDNSGSLMSSVWEYDPIPDQWTQKHDFEGFARSGAVGFTVGGKGYLCTGGSSGKAFDDNWVFDPLAEYNAND